jgi:hypothetical protein
MAHNGGSVQVGLTGPELWSNTVMLNLMKQAYYIYAYDGVNPDTPPATDWPTYIGANRYPTAMPPSGHTWKISGVYVYCDVGDAIDLVYPSQHTLSLVTTSYTVSESTIGPGHKRYTVTSLNGTTDPFSPCVVYITAMSGSDWTGGIKIYYTTRNGVSTDYATRLDAGEIFDPIFLTQCGYGTSRPFGSVRFMDWGGTNYNFSRTLSLLNSASDMCYVGLQVNVTYWAGQATKTASRNNYTTATRLPGNPASWVDGQVVQFRLGSALSTRTGVTVTAGNPTTLDFGSAHGFSNGEKILFARHFESENWQVGTQKGVNTTGHPPSFAITSTGANTLTIALDSTGWGNLSNVVVYPEFSVTDGTLPAKLVFHTSMFPLFSTWFGTASELVTAIYDSHFDCLYTSPSEGGSFSTMTPGMPISVMCALANKLKAHGWFCMPPNLNDASMQSYASAVFASLDSDLWAIFEHSNEVWNSGFPVFALSASRSAKEFSSWDWSKGQGWMNDRMADAVAAVAGSRQYRNAWGVQNVSTNQATQDALFECDSVSGGIEADFTINKYDFIATAPYYNTGFTYSGTAAAYSGYVTAIQGSDYAWMADQLTTSSGINEQIDDHITTYIPSWIAAAARFRGRRGAYGIKVVCYEGGCHVVGANSIDGGFPASGVSVADVQAFWINYLSSAAHAGVMTDYLTRLKTAGVYMPSQFTVAGVWTTGGTWGMQKIPQSSVTPQWTAAKAVNDVGLTVLNPTYSVTTG